MGSEAADLTIDDKLFVLKATWPAECDLVGDHYLRILASGEYEITQPDGGQNFDLKALFDFLSSGLRVITVVGDIVKNALKKKEPADLYDVIRELDRQGANFIDIQTDSLRVIIRRTHDALTSKELKAGESEGNQVHMG